MNRSRISRRNKAPLYHQVVEAIKSDIRNGHYKAGDMIPSQRELCKMCGASRITVVKAMDILSKPAS